MSDIPVMGGVDLGDPVQAREWVDAAVDTVPLLADPPPRMNSVVLDRIPLGRHGQTGGVVSAAVFLASDEACWISGAHPVVDGGSVLG